MDTIINPARPCGHRITTVLTTAIAVIPRSPSHLIPPILQPPISGSQALARFNQTCPSRAWGACSTAAARACTLQTRRHGSTCLRVVLVADHRYHNLGLASSTRHLLSGGHRPNSLSKCRPRCGFGRSRVILSCREQEGIALCRAGWLAVVDFLLLGDFFLFFSFFFWLSFYFLSCVASCHRIPGYPKYTDRIGRLCALGLCSPSKLYSILARTGWAESGGWYWYTYFSHFLLISSVLVRGYVALDSLGRPSIRQVRFRQVDKSTSHLI